MSQKENSIFELRQWDEEEAISDRTSINLRGVKSAIKLFNQDCTIPFIARYRCDQTGGLTAEKLREIQDCVETIQTVNKKVETIVKNLTEEEKESTNLISDLVNAKTLSEVEFLNTSCKKTSGKQTLADRASQLGLQESALTFLNPLNIKPPLLCDYIQPGTKGLSTEDEIFLGWQHIIADKIAKDRKVLDFANNQVQTVDTRITSVLSETRKKKDKQAFVEGQTTNNFKFENYFNFCQTTKRVKPHQIMAINRGEQLKILTVKIEFPNVLFDSLSQFCKNNWNIQFQHLNESGRKLLENSITDSLNRLLIPYLKRHIRSELTKSAIKESIGVFQQNLKSLLLRPPVRGKVVLGIDPGFKNGCKMAVVSQSGELLETQLINICSKPGVTSSQAKVLTQLVAKHQCCLIALGNGTASREVEQFLSDLIKTNTFHPFDVRYVTVSEAGASVYSVSVEAEAEFPDLNPNFRSAVSIARRLQDPLLELFKVGPKHLGVGMYQHDISDAQLNKALDNILVECASFVGIDLNLCPEFLLKKIAGLNATKAKNIIEWRNKNGPFSNREQLNQVKGIGQKSYEQCSGFVKIYPETFSSKSNTDEIEKESELPAKNQPGKRKKATSSKPSKKIKLEINPLDATIIHPESYTLVDKLIDYLNLSKEDIGSAAFIQQITAFDNISDFTTLHNVQPCTLNLILQALKQPLDYDIRSEYDEPLFVRGINSMNNLKVGVKVTGQVQNITHFGAFVDIGVEKSGLIHVSKMGSKTVIFGQRVEVEILSLDIPKGRIGLQLL